MKWKSTIRFGSKAKKGYTYTAIKEFETKKEAQEHYKNRTKDPHVKQKHRITKIRKSTTKTKKNWF